LGRGCDLEDLAACGLLGLHTPDAEQAVTLLRKACGGGDWPSCPPLAKRVQGNDIMALLDRACMVGAEAEACMMLSDRYKRGEGVAKDKARAKDLASRANELGWEEGS
jgi:TPR repeat protein